ncbi:hypothetical protein, partial [Klebsiella pneumoniae]|uniref:hypothetical protein n=1 Tax=Klebsiella pneumoniae TaxID=573 RepID=UPI0025A06EB9
MERLGITVTDRLQKERATLALTGRSVSFIAVSGAVSGLIVFEDRLRPEAPALVRRLSGLGVRKVVMLTGDA